MKNLNVFIINYLDKYANEITTSDMRHYNLLNLFSYHYYNKDVFDLWEILFFFGVSIMKSLIKNCDLFNIETQWTVTNYFRSYKIQLTNSIRFEFKFGKFDEFIVHSRLYSSIHRARYIDQANNKFTYNDYIRKEYIGEE